MIIDGITERISNFLETLTLMNTSRSEFCESNIMARPIRPFPIQVHAGRKLTRISIGRRQGTDRVLRSVTGLDLLLAIVQFMVSFVVVGLEECNVAASEWPCD